jgi:hypothetical protein
MLVLLPASAVLRLPALPALFFFRIAIGLSLSTQIV